MVCCFPVSNLYAKLSKLASGLNTKIHNRCVCGMNLLMRQLQESKAQNVELFLITSQCLVSFIQYMYCIAFSTMQCPCFYLVLMQHQVTVCSDTVWCDVYLCRLWRVKLWGCRCGPALPVNMTLLWLHFDLNDRRINTQSLVSNWVTLRCYGRR